MKFSTRAIHAGQPPEPRTGAVAVPVFQTSTYAQRSPGVHSGYEYARTRNPTREALEECVAALEGGRFGVAFASGLAAEDAFLHLLEAGDQVVCTDDVYGGTRRLFERVFRKHSLDFRWVDTTNPAAVEAALTPRTRWVWVETPTNPMLKLTDLAAVASITHRAGARLAVDNTFSSPFFQRPLEHGADLVIHSSTKYLGGHSDVVGGLAVTADPELHDRLRFLQNAVGGVPGPWDAWLVLRGVKTLAVRMQRHFENALAVARHLESHPRVARVIYPWLPSHPQHGLATRQMTGMSGMITITLRSDLDGARRFLESVRVFTLAESLGGVESLIEHPAIMTHASVPPEVRAALGIEDTLIRLSVGIEDLDDLLEDLDRGLAAMGP
ncbi:MAG: cystathionine gamma-synthase [Deltaproteobacteria bacterium]|nr:cystathionine gamma-synthase [Deltaproteobacteria bacterium]